MQLFTGTYVNRYTVAVAELGPCSPPLEGDNIDRYAGFYAGVFVFLFLYLWLLQWCEQIQLCSFFLCSISISRNCLSSQVQLLTAGPERGNPKRNLPDLVWLRCVRRKNRVTHNDPELTSVKRDGGFSANLLYCHLCWTSYCNTQLCFYKWRFLWYQ